MENEMDANNESHSDSDDCLLDSNDSVEENDTDGDDNNETVPTPQDFDLTLPTSHSYLGDDMEEFRNRTIFDDGIYMNLPLLVKQSVVLFPNETLPLAVFDRNTVTMLEKCIVENGTFGVVSLKNNNQIESIGTTAQIFEFKHDGFYKIFIKAVGRQRFRVLNLKKGSITSAMVKILPEITLGDPFYKLKSLDNQRINPINEYQQKKQNKLEKLEAMMTCWPDFVYKQYDPYVLSYKIKQQLRFIETKGSYIPMNPTDLSFWVAHNFPLNDEDKLKLLKYDCAIPRLQWELEYLTKDRVIVCRKCENVIGKHSNIFPMSVDGPQNTFCNLGGHIHETLTLYHAENLKLDDRTPSSYYSWFPGYEWTIATCQSCSHHIGWLFTVEKDNTLRPKSFWGLSGQSVKSKKCSESILEN